MVSARKWLLSCFIDMECALAECRWAVNAAKMVDWTTQSYFRMAFLALQVVTYAYK